jgi:hypothetical protein
VFGVIVPIAEDRGAEKELFALRIPISGVEYTPVGGVELVVTNGVKEAQNECPVAAVVPLVPFRIASVEVIAVAGFVITGATSACATEIEAIPKEPTVKAKSVKIAVDFLIIVNFFCIIIVNFLVIYNLLLVILRINNRPIYSDIYLPQYC